MRSALAAAHPAAQDNDRARACAQRAVIGIDTIVESRAAAESATRAEWGAVSADIDADEDEAEGGGDAGASEPVGSVVPQMLLSRRGRRGWAATGVTGLKEATGWRRLATAGVYLRLGWTVSPSAHALSPPSRRPLSAAQRSPRVHPPIFRGAARPARPSAHSPLILRGFPRPTTPCCPVPHAVIEA